MLVAVLFTNEYMSDIFCLFHVMLYVMVIKFVVGPCHLASLLIVACMKEEVLIGKLTTY